ncbi:hypothetical protein BDV93DRAFT_519830 [Ceratobasidium sp. AG-I]|nr:hypothetical protein BDV93DRAFT_519830 [Ceratobasidium sp. AG-I]
MSLSPEFDGTPILKYLSLDEDYTPSPSKEPIEFLKRHINQLPPHLLVLFSSHPKATPRARSSIPTIRNRRCNYAAEEPKALDPDILSREDAAVWDLVNDERPQGQMTVRPTTEQSDEDAADERAWADQEFQGGIKGHVGKIGELLGQLQEERTRERQRAVRRQAVGARRREEETMEEEEESTDEGEEEEGDRRPPPADAAEKDIRRLVRERFISGLLSEFDYDVVDWDEKWDPDDRDNEDRWFDEEEES